MTWNILLGGETRFESIVEQAVAAKPDLLLLQECLGWDDRARLSRLAEALGLPDDPRHAALGLARPRGSGKRYHLAVLSRRPLDSLRSHADPHFIGHALVEARIGDLQVFAAHFDSHHENLRFVEARFLRSLLDPARFAAAPFLLAGDLNALSRRDPYPADLAARLAAAGTDKYGLPPRFEVVDEIEAMGWIDLLHAQGPPPRWITARRERGGVRIDYRTDYLFASPSLAARRTSMEILDVRGASDHDAVVADFAMDL